MNNLAEFLIKVREDLQLSQKDFAKKLGISPSTLSRIENGQRNPQNIVIKILKGINELSYDFNFNDELTLMENIENYDFSENMNNNSKIKKLLHENIELLEPTELRQLFNHSEQMIREKKKIKHTK